VYRYTGLILVVLLVLVGMAQRSSTVDQARQLLDAERQARATVSELYRRSVAYTAKSEPHPGLASIIEDMPELQLIAGESTIDLAYARDDVYIYGLTTTSSGTGRVIRGFILRAWPQEFGLTGDREFQIQQDGVLWMGLNRKGRSGTGFGFPPQFPDPEFAKPNPPWLVVSLDADQDAAHR
jgi:hypothetical protein